jgi:hypothetical protein
MFRRLLLLAGLGSQAFGYAVLTHEAIIDTVWLDSLKPLLLKRFPQASEEDLKKAHAYAYGGAIIQDSGYYPFGSHLFSDLVHYVRSGDFILTLIRDAQDLNEYAFALGSLSHCAADEMGHSIATNHVVPMLYPKLKARYGEVVTYEDNPAAHLKTEFGLDVAQVARGHYAPDSYHNFIGFEVSKPLLDRAFKDTYAIELKDVFLSVDLALGTYRRTVSNVIPGTTKIAWELKQDDLRKAEPTISRKKFVYNLSRASYEKEWGTEYKRPGWKSRLMAWIIRVTPKVGPFRALSFKAPTPAAENLFVKSFNATVDRYRELLRESRSSRFALENRNFDTGEPVVAGKYRKADDTYAQLVDRLKKRNFAAVPADLRADIERFYGPSKVENVDRMK